MPILLPHLDFLLGSFPTILLAIFLRESMLTLFFLSMYLISLVSVKVLPLHFLIPMDPNFDFSNVESRVVLFEQAKILKFAHIQFPDALVAHLSETYLPEILRTLPVVNDMNSEASFVNTFIQMLSLPAQMMHYMQMNCIGTLLIYS
jgi:hypothetical protein